MSLSLCGRRVQVFPLSSLAETSAEIGDLNQLWHEVNGPAAEAFPFSRSEIAFHASCVRRAVQLHSLAEGKRAHCYVVSAGLDHNVLLGNLLLQMYGFGGSLQDARAVFKRMQHRDVSSWTLLIKSYARYDYLDQALCLFSQMQSEITLLDNASIGSLLSACSGKNELFIVRLLHSFMIESSLTPTVSVSTAFLSIYGKSGCLQDAKLMFDRLHERDVVSWNAMIASFTSEQKYVDAFHLYHRMILDGFNPDRSTYLSILTACARQKDILEGRLIHHCIFEYELKLDIGVANALVNMYGDCDSMDNAQCVFNQISATNVVSWNSMIAGLARNGKEEEALLLFGRMQRNAIAASNVTFINALSACSSPVVLEQGQLLYHYIVVLGLEIDVVIVNAIVNMYGKCGDIRDAKATFEKSHTHDRVSWTSLLTLCASHGQEQDVSRLYEQMQTEGVVPDRVTFVSISVAFTNEALLYKCKQLHTCILSSSFVSDVNLHNSLITMYGKCGSAAYAEKIFARMPKCDLMSWNAIFCAYLQNGLAELALSLLNRMGCENIFPDKFLCSSILSACALATTQDRGKQMHTFAVINAFDVDLTVSNSVLNMYGKFGNLDDALRVFERMPKRDIVSWSAVIGAYAQQGEGKTAVNLYSKMSEEGVASDKVALVHLLSACSHDGLVDEGLRHFLALANEEDGELLIDHFNCMVDLLTRAGRLEEAEQLLLKLPLTSSAVAWTTLLGACRSQIDVKRGEYAASRVFQLSPHDAAPYVTLSNLYFAAGKIEEAFEVIMKMRQLGLGKEIDSSTIDVLGGHRVSSVVVT